MELINKDTRNTYWAEAAAAQAQDAAPNQRPYTCDEREDVGVSDTYLHRVDRGRLAISREAAAYVGAGPIGAVVSREANHA